jgi:uncharacterized LabA/DUF88 family protein
MEDRRMSAFPGQEARIALLIDADNSPADKIDVILAELAKFGVANIRRAYGNWKKSELKGWEAALHDYAIRPIQQFDYSKGKNATDMGMVIDAMDLLYSDKPEGFGIVSSDSDFTPLVLHLKAKGAKVYGFGAKKTPMPFVNACSRFLYLETLGESDVMELPEAAPAKAVRPTAARKTRTSRSKAGAVAVNAAGLPAATQATAVGNMAPPAQTAPVSAASSTMSAAPSDTSRAAAERGGSRKQDRAALCQDARLVTLLRNAVSNAAQEDGWSALSAVGKQIGNQASFDSRNYGYRKLGDLIEATQLFDMERRETHTFLRDKRRAHPR